MGAKRIAVHGDSELIINQVKGIYQSKHPRLRAYRNIVLDLLEEFSKYNLSVIPRGAESNCGFFGHLSLSV